MVWILYIAGTAFSLFLAWIAIRDFGDKQPKGSLAGLRPAGFILLSFVTWIIEANLATSAVLGRFPTINNERQHYSAWAPLTLWWPPEALSHFSSLSWTKSPGWLCVVVSLALLTAVTLSALRLRNAGLPVWLGLLALIPFVNFGLFTFLSVVPAEKQISIRTWKDYVLPRNALGSAVVSCVATASLGVAVSQFSTVRLGAYGSVLFALVPVVMGFIAASIYGLSEPRSSSACMSVALASVVLGGLAILGFAIEGFICVLMAAPLALPLAALGGWLGYLAQKRPEVSSQSPQIAGALLLLLPFMMVGEQHAHHGARQIAVSTSIVIHAPADRAWKSVIHLSSVPKPDSAIFYSVAYPIKTTLEGTGVGAQRQCVFSTGSIIEPIEVWQPGRELRFSVVSQPPLMRELSPYPDVHPPHLKLHYLRSEAGQFTLTPQADGSTLLTGTSYYESRLWPGAYWQIWTDGIAHRVHQVVLEEIKREAEM